LSGWQFRPAKQIIRQMGVDAMRRLASFRRLSDYRYVGMGGYEFVDFDLVRRGLGVRRMTSIESEIEEDRLKFNKPFLEVEIEMGTSNEVLPNLPLDEPSIIWMDYCSRLRHDEIRDAILLGERMQPGSMLLISVNASPDGKDNERLERLEARVGRDRVPFGVTENKDLDGWLTAEVQRRILLTAIRDGLAKRGEPIRFEQMLNIHYSDTTKMQTLGGVFVDPATDDRFERADFGSLDYVKTDADALRVRVPVMTAREVLDLEAKLKAGKTLHGLSWLKPEEVESFVELHRWYPRVPAPM
jgi:hypothetical protein